MSRKILPLWRSVRVLGVLGFLFLQSCASVPIPHSCRISGVLLGQHKGLSLVDRPKVGESYSFEGTYYSEFEDSGLIAAVAVRPEHLEDLKLSAYCVVFEEPCLEFILETWEELGSRDFLLELEALVRYESEAGVAHEFATNQCTAGTLRVLKLRRLRIGAPSVSEEVPEEVSGKTIRRAGDEVSGKPWCQSGPTSSRQSARRWPSSPWSPRSARPRAAYPPPTGGTSR